MAKEEKKDTGRPIKLNAEVQADIVKAIKAGNYLETAAAYAGINKSTLHDWLRRGEREKQSREKGEVATEKEQIFVEFSDSVEKALAEAEVRDVYTISKAAESQWQAAAWRLERKFPKKWGRKDYQKLEHSGGVGITVQWGVDDDDEEDTDNDE